MAKKPANSGKQWTRADDSKLRSAAADNTPTRVIGLQLQRTESAVRTRAAEIDLSLKPTNQSPYSRKKS